MNSDDLPAVVAVTAPSFCRRAVDPLRLVVGEVYDSGIRRWPGQELILTTARCLVLVDVHHEPTAEEIHEFRTGEARFAWIDTRHTGILCCRFGTSRWMMLPFNPHRDTPEGLTAGVPGVAAGQRLPVAIGLIDCESPVYAIRNVHWPEHFADVVGATVRRLATQGYDAEQAVNESNCLYLYVRDEKLVQRAVSSIRVNTAEGDQW